jgi:hypothetical protein
LIGNVLMKTYPMRCWFRGKSATFLDRMRIGTWAGIAGLIDDGIGFDFAAAGMLQMRRRHDLAQGKPREPKAMSRPLFLPTARQTNLLLIVAFLSVGDALYVRYIAIENLNVELACQAGLKTWLCSTFRLSIVLFNHEVFGAVALIAALLNLLRPSIVLVAVALAAGGYGIVLHNPDLSALAAGVLILSLARPAPAAE